MPLVSLLAVLLAVLITVFWFILWKRAVVMMREESEQNNREGTNQNHVGNAGGLADKLCGTSVGGNCHRPRFTNGN